MDKLTQLFQILNSVLPNKVTYGTNTVDALDLDVYPFIIYQEISDRSSSYADNKPLVRIITYQITLVTKEKDPTLQILLERTLYDVGYDYQMVTEYINEDNSVNRAYEIKLEEFNHD